MCLAMSIEKTFATFKLADSLAHMFALQSKCSIKHPVESSRLSSSTENAHSSTRRPAHTTIFAN